MPSGLLGPLPAPRLNLCMVAGGENRRYLPALEKLGPGIVRVFEKPAFETLVLAGRLFAHDPRQKPDHGIEERQSRRFPARKDEIPEADLLHLAGLDDPLVEPLEAPAEKGDAGPRGQLPHPLLGKGRAARAQIDERPRVPRWVNRIDRRRHDIGPHDHARPAACRRIVHGAVPVRREGTDIDRLEAPGARFERPARQRQAERPRKHPREEREDGGRPAFSHHPPPGSLPCRRTSRAAGRSRPSRPRYRLPARSRP